MDYNDYEPMSDEDVLEALQDTEAVRHGHFKLTSGRHSDTYVQCARINESPQLTNRLGAEAVRRLPVEVRDSIDLVAAPAVGGILYGFAIANALGCRYLFSERVDGKMVFRRNFEVHPGERVLVSEDVVTTGGSVKEVCDLVEAAGGTVVAVTSMISRGGSRAFDYPYYPLLALDVASWDPEDCLLCKRDEPITSPGSRRLTATK